MFVGIKCFPPSGFLQNFFIGKHSEFRVLCIPIKKSLSSLERILDDVVASSRMIMENVIGSKIYTSTARGRELGNFYPDAVTLQVVLWDLLIDKALEIGSHGLRGRRPRSTTFHDLEQVLDDVDGRSHSELALPRIEESHDAVVLQFGEDLLGLLETAVGLQQVSQLRGAELLAEVAVVEVAHGGSESGSRNGLHAVSWVLALVWFQQSPKHSFCSTYWIIAHTYYYSAAPQFSTSKVQQWDLGVSAIAYSQRTRLNPLILPSQFRNDNGRQSPWWTTRRSSLPHGSQQQRCHSQRQRGEHAATDRASGQLP